MKVVIIGGGFTGLSAAAYLVDRDVEVEVWETSDRLGGLAKGFEVDGWDWSLEKYYHHVFANDRKIINLSYKVGWPVFLKRPVTNVWADGKEEQLDSPISLLSYSGLSWWQRIRMGVGLASLKIIFNKELGQKLERYRVNRMLPKLIGKKAYQKVWEPLLIAKFGKYADEVNMAWFWARVVKRTSKLGYFEGGFGKLAEKIGEYIESKGGAIRLNEKAQRVEKSNGRLVVGGEEFDRVLLTVPSGLVNNIVGEKVIDLPEINYLWGQTLVLEMKKSLIESYWLNILERNWPFLVAVEHTKFISKEKYGGSHVLYLGNYLEEGDERLDMKKEELLEMFLPYLKKINPSFEKNWIKRSWKFQSSYAQPVFPVNYSEEILDLKTKIDGLYMANMSQVYPWDRGTNFAVDIGERAAKLILKDKDDL